MRSFEERKAEIISRSQKRIKSKKQNRKRVLAFCSPFCLCVAIFSVIYLPDILTSANKNNFTADTGASEMADGESGFSYSLVEVAESGTSTGVSKTETDIANIENIYNIIQSSFYKEEVADDIYTQYTASGNGNDQSMADGGLKAENYNSSYSSYKKNSATKGSFRTITFTAKDGTKIKYILKGNKITDSLTKKEVILTDEQLNNLNKALGIVS